MDLQGQRDLQLLREVEQDPGVTQRSLAGKLGVALGLTNLYLKRLARKGYIKITTIPKHRMKYLVTPQGVAQKSRLTYEFMQYSMTYYRDMRQRLKRVMADLATAGAKRIVIYGTGELAELAYLSVRETDLTLVCFVEGQHGRTFLSYPLLSVEELVGLEFDAVLIGDLKDAGKICSRLVLAGINDGKVVSLVPNE